MFTETMRYPGQQETGAYILITTLNWTFLDIKKHNGNEQTQLSEIN